MEFHKGQEIKVNGRLATVLKTGLQGAYGNNSIEYQMHDNKAIIKDNPALSSYYGNRVYENA
jgi:hypothetical protein